MTADALLTESAACPRCDKTPLTRKKKGYFCPACQCEFSDVGGIPWLFADPDAALGEWRNRLHFSLQQLAHESKRLGAELIADEQRTLTRQRLDQLKTATDKHRNILQQILSPIDVQSMQVSYESHLAMRTRLHRDRRHFTPGGREGARRLPNREHRSDASCARAGVDDTPPLSDGQPGGPRRNPRRR